MSGINHNITDAKVLTTQEGDNGGVGGYQEVFEFQAGTNNISSASLVDIAGMTSQTFVSPVSGIHLFHVDMSSYIASGSAGGLYVSALNIDGTDYELTQYSITPDTNYSQRETATRSVAIELSAGEHTIKPRIKVVSGPNFQTSSNDYWTVSVSAQGSGINGLEVSQKTDSTNRTISTTSPTFTELTEHTHVINTLEGERVQISFNATADGSSEIQPMVGYKIDGGTEVRVMAGSVNSTSDLASLNFNAITEELSAGQHTIVIACTKNGGNNYDVRGGSSYPNFSTVTRFKSFGIGAGSILGSDDLTADFTVSSTSYADTGLDITFNTAQDNETILLSYTGSVVCPNSALSVTARIAYQLDGGSDEVVTGTTFPANVAFAHDISFCIPISIPTAGEHTIKLRAKRDQKNVTLIWSGSATDAGAGALRVVQYRGGLIPVKNADGTEVVDKPSALKFGDGAIVSAEGTEAKIDFPKAALGGYVETLIQDNPASNQDNSNTSYAALTGISQTSFTTPVSGKHLFLFNTGGYGQTADHVAYYRIVIDKGEAGEQILGDSDIWRQFYETTDAPHFSPTFIEDIELAAGTHTVDVEVKVSAGFLRRNGNDHTSLTVMAQGTGINGLEVAEYEMVNDFAVTQAWSDVDGGNMAQVDSVQVDVNTLEGERVQVSFVGTGNFGGGSESIALGYQVDSDTPINALYVYDADTTGLQNISFSVMTDPLSAGKHTIKLTASKAVGSPTILGSTNSTTDAKFQVTRFKSFGIGAGTIVAEDSLASSLTPMTASSYTDTGLDVTFTTAFDDEWVTINFEGVARTTSGNTNSGSFILATQLDGATEVPVMSVSALGDEDTLRKNVSFSKDIKITTAGEHTLKLRYYVSGSTSWEMVVDAVTEQILQVKQSRGGIIPIKKEGTQIVEKPSAINFKGSGCKVTQNGTEADVEVFGGNYTYRGDPASVDFDETDLTEDAAWHTLDLSSIVPEGASAVHIGVNLDPADTDNVYIFFDHGDATNNVANNGLRAYSGVAAYGSYIVPLNSDREIKYKAKSDTYDGIDLTVIGWLMPVDNMDWQSWTPTGSWSTNTTYSGFYKIVGDTMHCRVKIALSGAPTSANLSINLPSGYQIDTSKVPSITTRTPFGQFIIIDTGTAQHIGVVTAPASGTTSVNCFVYNASATYLYLQQVTQSLPMTFASGDSIELEFSFPVTEV